MIYAPTYVGGLGLPHIYLEQGIAHIKLWLEYEISNTMTGKLMRIAMDQLQLKVGLFIPVLTENFDHYGGLATVSWIRTLCEFCFRIGIQLIYKVEPRVKPSQVWDEEIMVILQKLNISDMLLNRFNRVRKYLQVVSMEDIVTGRGDEIQTLARLGKRDFNIRSIWEWPKEFPSECGVSIWRLYMLRISLTNYSIEKPLGKWIHASHWKDLWWQENDVLWKQTDVWEAYVLGEGNLRSTKYYRSENKKSPIEEILTQKATVLRIENGIIVNEGWAETIEERDKEYDCSLKCGKEFKSG